MECVNLLFLILLFSLSHTVRAKEETLDMAPNAVDDIFSGCRDRMLQTVIKTDGLLHDELQANKKFSDRWNRIGTCEKENNGLTSFHLRALELYGNSEDRFRNTFNNMVYTKGSNATTYKNEFFFKSLHFLLTDALQLLNESKGCSTVYYGTDKKYTAETGKKIRFGKFLWPSNSKSAEEEKCVEDECTLFEITSCSVVKVDEYACSSEDVEQLISPTEVFTVEKIQPVNNTDGEYKMITLTHSHFLSNHDCYMFDGTAGGSSSPLLSSIILALVSSFLSLYYCTAPQ